MEKLDAVIRNIARLLVLLIVAVTVMVLLMAPVVLMFAVPLWYLGWIDLDFLG